MTVRVCVGVLVVRRCSVVGSEEYLAVHLPLLPLVFKCSVEELLQQPVAAEAAATTTPPTTTMTVCV